MSEIVNNSVSEEHLDNEIKPVEPGFFLANNGKLATEFYQSGNEVILVNKDRRISWTPNDMRYLDEFGMEDTIYTVQEVPLETKGNYARYNRAMPDVDDWFIVENDRLKHQILIQGFQPEPSPWLMGKIDFAIGGKMRFDSDLIIIADDTEQFNSFETHGGIQLFDGNELIFELPQIVAFDSAYDRNVTFGKYRVWFNDNAEMMFDIIVDYAWISSLERVYPIVIDPTVISSGSYSVSGNGKKILELENGTLISSALLADNIYLFKSTDQGSTWSQMCFIDGTSSIKSWSIECKDNLVYVFFNDNADFALCTINVTSQTNVNIYSTRTFPPLTDLGIGFSSGIDTYHDKARGVIHLGFIDNAALPRYCKVTVSGGGSLTFGADPLLQSDTVFDTFGISVTINPSTGNPVIAELSTAPAGQYLKVYRYSGTVWSTTILVTQLQNDTMSNINIIHDVNGKMHMTYSLFRLLYGRNQTIYRSSIDNGAAWSAASSPFGAADTINHTNPTITCDYENVLYIHYTNGGNIYKSTSVDTGTSWSSSSNVAAGTMNAVNFDSDFSDALVSLLYVNGTTLGYQGILLNAAPNAPANLQRASFDAVNSAAFTWTYNDPNPLDPQSAYQLQIVNVGTGAIVKDTGKVVSASGSYTLAAGTLTNGNQYQWRVKTWDSADLEGPYSTYATFYTSGKPSLTITNITDGETYGLSSITPMWSISDPESEGQGAYQVKLTTPADVVLYDSGKVADSRSRSKTIPYQLANNTSYKVKVTVWDAKDIPATEQVKTINVSYTTPKTPVLSSTEDTNRGTINVEVVNDSNVVPYPNPLTANFVGKVAGSTVENPHISKAGSGASLIAPSGTWATEFPQSSYDRINKLDGLIPTTYFSTVANGSSIQQLFSFNLIEEYKRKIGLTLSVQQVKDVTKKLTANWHGYGSGPSGNKASLNCFNNGTGAYINPATHTSSAISKLAWVISGGAIVTNNVIDNNGFAHFLAYADASNGTVASTINTDYIELLTEFDYKKLIATLPKVISNEIYRRIIGENEWKRVGYVTPKLYGKNLLPPFTEWTLHANATVKKPYELELVATALDQNSSVNVNVLPDTPYVFSGTPTGTFEAYFLDANGAYLGNSFSFTSGSLTRISPSNAVKLNVRCTNRSGATGTFTFTHPQIELGSVATAFEPQKLGETFVDYTPASGETYEYYVKASGENGVTVNSAVVNDVVEFKDAQLALVSDFSKWAKLRFNGNRSEDRKYKRTMMEFAGRKDPLPEFGEQKNLGLSLSYSVIDVDILDSLIELCESQETLLYRDSRGRKEFVTVDGLSIKDEKLNSWTVSLNPERSYFEEGV